MDVSIHFAVLQSVATNPYDASVTGVPSEHAVSVALQSKQDKINPIAPITASEEGNVGLNYGEGLSVSNGNLVSDKTFIVTTVDNLMLSDAGPADQSTAYVNGGTVYTILGNCSITTSVASTGASDTKVPTEAAVRSAVNAAIATGGSTVVPGKAINVTGGSINVTASPVEQVLGSTVASGATNVTPVTQNDLSALTPKALYGALSLTLAEDLSSPPRYFDAVDSFPTPASWNYLSTFTLTKTSAGSGTHYYGGFTGSPSFPFLPYKSGHKYLILMDIRNASSVALADYGFNSSGSVPIISVSGVPYHTSSGITANQASFVRHAAVIAGQYINFSARQTTGSAATIQIEIKNWRQYDVTELTDDAIAFLAKLPNPDAFFRDSNVSNLIGKYMIKHEMVSPYIKIETVNSNTNLTVFPGKAYSLAFTDNNTHTISAAALPTDTWAHETFLQLTVKDPTKVVFDGINLMSTLRANAINNIIIKFRAGRVNAYVEDTDVGYIVTLNSGSQNGSLAYGLGNNVGNYIVFSDTTNIT